MRMRYEAKMLTSGAVVGPGAAQADWPQVMFPGTQI